VYAFSVVASRRLSPLAGRVLWLALGCYLLALVVAPLFHHDLECHAKSPTHCGACMASPPGVCSTAGAPVDATRFHDAGSVEAGGATAPVSAFAVDAPGRSPPA
jgi:hypothetical protein